jgi:hypothetical protein
LQFQFLDRGHGRRLFLCLWLYLGSSGERQQARRDG